MKIYKISILLITLSVFFGIKSFSQSNDSAHKVHYEIGLSVPLVEAIYGFKPFYYYQFLSFKIEKNRNALRTSFGTGLPIYYGEVKKYTHIASIGYERRIFKRKSQLLLGIDLNYYYNYYESWYNSEKMTMYSIGPVIAYLYKPTEHFAFQLQFPLSVGPSKRTDFYGHIQKGTSTLLRSDILTAYYRF